MKTEAVVAEPTLVDAGDLAVDTSQSSLRAPWSRPELVGVGLLAAFVWAAGAWHLGQPGFWNDEAATWAISGHGLGGVFSTLRSSGGDSAAGLYYLLEHFWISIFGSSESAMRSLSVIAAGACVVPFYAIARRVTTPGAAWVATAFLATSPFFLSHAREARTYAFALLLVLLASLAFLRALESRRTRDWLLYAFVATIAVYAHWFSGFVIAAHYASLVPFRRRGLPTRAIATSAAIIGACMLPIAFLVIAGRTSGIDWIAPLNVTELRNVAAAFTGTHSWKIQLIFLVVIVAALVGIVAALRHPRSPADAHARSLAVAWLVVPIVIATLVSLFKPVLVDRYLIVAFPGFVLLVGIGLARLARDRLTLVALAAIVFLLGGAFGLRHLWSDERKGEDWRAIAEDVGRFGGPTDAVVVFPASSVSALAYYARATPGLSTRDGPTWPPGSWNKRFDRSEPAMTAVQALKRANPRVVWLVVREPTGGTVRPDVATPPELLQLRRFMDRRYPSALQLVPSNGHRATVVLKRYVR